jgi:hypothetical protein
MIWNFGVIIALLHADLRNGYSGPRRVMTLEAVV